MGGIPVPPPYPAEERPAPPPPAPEPKPAPPPPPPRPAPAHRRRVVHIASVASRPLSANSRGFWIRLLAYVIDSVILGIVNGILSRSPF
jgi:hypothetical protein